MSYKSRIGPWLEGAASVAVIGASVIVGWVALSNRAVHSGGSAAQGPATPETLNPPVVIDLPVEQARPGNVALLEFSDYQCPFCGRYAREVLPDVKRNLIAAKKIDYVFLNFPLEQIHPFAFQAAKAAECARESGRFWEMHDALFSDQQLLQADSLKSRAETIGIDKTRFAACMTDDAAAKIVGDQKLAKQLGVNATPTFFIGRIVDNGHVRVTRRLHGFQPYSAFTAALAEEAKQEKG